MASLLRSVLLITLSAALASPVGARAQGAASQPPQAASGPDIPALVSRIDAVRLHYTSSRLSAARDELSGTLDLARFHVERADYAPAEAALTRALETTGREADCVTAIFNAASAQRKAASSGFQPPRKIKDVKPVYPALAQRARVSGVVVIEGMIGADGRVQCARVMKSVPLLDLAALDAVGQWEFSPMVMAGTPVPTRLTTSVNFTLQ